MDIFFKFFLFVFFVIIFFRVFLIIFFFVKDVRVTNNNIEKKNQNDISFKSPDVFIVIYVETF